VDALDRLQLEVPVVQAGLGGGIARAELAAAVSAAGGLGTLGILPPELLRRELRRARERAPGRPVAVNLLLPYVVRGHADVCVQERPTVAVLFCGHDRRLALRLREAGIVVLHQVGTVGAARRALAEGAAGLVVQGVEAGGHVLATRPLASLLPEVRALAGSRPVLAAGGIVDAEDVRRVRAHGADLAVAGTRFLLTEESGAHPAYLRRVVEATATVRTRLFGLGWRDPHRVVVNEAVRRWCHPSGEARALPSALTAATLPLARHVPVSAAGRLQRMQRVGVPLFTPAALLRGEDERLLDTTPLYAGGAVDRLTDVVPAAEAVRRLATSP
jgi:nitronate monooxygenase